MILNGECAMRRWWWQSEEGRGRAKSQEGRPLPSSLCVVNVSQHMAGSSATIPRRAGVRRPLLVALVYGITVIATTAIFGSTVLVATRAVLFTDVRDYLEATA